MALGIFIHSGYSKVWHKARRGVIAAACVLVMAGIAPTVGFAKQDDEAAKASRLPQVSDRLDKANNGKAGVDVLDEMKDGMPVDERFVVRGEPSDFQKALIASTRIDRFFSDERFEDEVNFTRLRLRGNTFIREGDGVEFDPKTRFRYSFPGLERRVSLLVSGDFDTAVNEDEDHPLQSELKSLLEPREDEDAVFAVQAFLAGNEKYNISLQTGARFRSFSPEAFIGPRYRQTFDLDPWLVRLTQQVRWFTDDGLAARSVIDFEREFNSQFFLRVTPRANWSEEDEEFEYGIGAKLVQYLGPRHALTYEIALRAETEPVHQVDRVISRVRYRRRLWGEWLYVEVAPEIAFLRRNDFDVTPGVLIRLDTIFDLHW